MEVDFLVYFSSVSVRRQTWRTYSSPPDLDVAREGRVRMCY